MLLFELEEVTAEFNEATACAFYDTCFAVTMMWRAQVYEYERRAGTRGPVEARVQRIVPRVTRFSQASFSPEKPKSAGA